MVKSSASVFSSCVKQFVDWDVVIEVLLKTWPPPAWSDAQAVSAAGAAELGIVFHVNVKWTSLPNHVIFLA
jgi:hypothetical protein